MRKYSLKIGLLAVILTLSVSGCQKQEEKAAEEAELTDEIGAAEEAGETEDAGAAEEAETDTAKPLDESIEIGLTEANLDGMALYSSCIFMYGETDWELQTFVQEDMLVNGELAMDDRGHILVQAASGTDSYVLLDETVQLGMPEADVWIDEQEKLHIVLWDVRSARYRVTDFVYDLEKKKFIGSNVLNGDGINYLGTTGK